MTIDRAGTLIDLLRDSQLLEASQLSELDSTAEARDADPQMLAQCLLELGWLTPFQLDHLRHGRAADLKLGAYHLLDRLGEGGTGPAYKARRPGKKGTVTLKLIRKDRLASPQVASRFLQKVRTAAQLEHPNLAPVIAVSQVGNLYLFAREYVEGSDLATLVREAGPLPIARACDFTRQAAAALQHVHDKGLSHRRVKPPNLIARDARIIGDGSPAGPALKLVDVGLSQLKPRTQGEGAVDVEADLLGLGRTFHYMLTGRIPAPVAALNDAVSQSLDSLRPGIPAAVQTVVRRLLATGSAEGFRTAGEVAEALEPYCHEASEPVNGQVAAPAEVPAPAVAELPAAEAALPAALPVAEAVAFSVTGSADAVAVPLASWTPPGPENSSPADVPFAVALPATGAEVAVAVVAEAIAVSPAEEQPPAALPAEPVALEGIAVPVEAAPFGTREGVTDADRLASPEAVALEGIAIPIEPRVPLPPSPWQAPAPATEVSATVPADLAQPPGAEPPAVSEVVAVAFAVTSAVSPTPEPPAPTVAETAPANAEPIAPAAESPPPTNWLDLLAIGSTPPAAPEEAAAAVEPAAASPEPAPAAAPPPPVPDLPALAPTETPQPGVSTLEAAPEPSPFVSPAPPVQTPSAAEPLPAAAQAPVSPGLDPEFSPMPPAPSGPASDIPLGSPVSEGAPLSPTAYAPPADEGVTFPMGAAEQATTTRRAPAKKKWSRSTWIWLIVGLVLHLVAAGILIAAVVIMLNKEEGPPKKQGPPPKKQPAKSAS